MVDLARSCRHRIGCNAGCNAALKCFPRTVHTSARRCETALKSTHLAFSAGATSSGILKRSVASGTQEARQRRKTDEAGTTQALRSTPGQVACHVQHMPLTIAQAAIFKNPDLRDTRRCVETGFSSLVHCTLKDTSDSSQPLSVNRLSVQVGQECSCTLY